jgi:hypothetical protein
VPLCLELGHGVGFEEDTDFLLAIAQRWAVLREARLKQQQTG